MDLNKFSKNETTHSAVIVLHELATDSLILTKRSEQLRNHPGEISFPGGLWEENDLNFSNTALRELHEELGIIKERVTLIKELKDERTLSGIIIHPWLGQIESIEPYVLNFDEVTGLITIPMSLVHSAANYQKITVERYGVQFTTCEFITNNDYIWGATARIMKQLVIDSK
ncbi:NUDIX hydrolase [Legionella bononiensis]|uniref:NUDIX hydrolase n=1 Tax=Legionella bononiensis TaxID=2793102 RepID=UPI001932B35D|nr:CoA pyrophosphatase [Legionella bononiensis]MBL7478815.1 CoA pyrophosphatase [Legionella bononiensis]MBL7562461.1 CoA pyrophosphatase [Legionella bononiensis]